MHFFTAKLLCLILFHLWISCYLNFFAVCFFFFFIYFHPSSDVNFLALDFLINPITSAQTHVSIYMDLCECVCVCSKNGTPRRWCFISITRAGALLVYLRTLRHYARYTLDNMVFILNVQFILSSAWKTEDCFSGDAADGREDETEFRLA